MQLFFYTNVLHNKLYIYNNTETKSRIFFERIDVYTVGANSSPLITSPRCHHFIGPEDSPSLDWTSRSWVWKVNEILAVYKMKKPWSIHFFDYLIFFTKCLLAPHHSEFESFSDSYSVSISVSLTDLYKHVLVFQYNSCCSQQSHNLIN